MGEVASALTAIATVLLVAVTGYYAWLMQEIVRQDKMPVIHVLHIEKSVDTVRRPTVQIKNIGFGPEFSRRFDEVRKTPKFLGGERPTLTLP